MTDLDVTYSTGPRFVDGVNLDADVEAAQVVRSVELDISDPVTGLIGVGYEPGQFNRNGTEY
jgi:hypothetical protein